MYEARSSVQNNKTRTAISAVRTETMRFLFEKEGEVTIPEMVFSWYHPVEKKLYKRTLKEIMIQVQPNPDLGVLASVRDSLLMEQALEIQESGKEVPFTIMGLSPERFTLICLLAIIVLLGVLIFMKRFIRWLKIRRERFRNSEAFYFRLYAKALGRKNTKETLHFLYRWIDALQLSEPSIAFFTNTYGSKKLQQAIWKAQQGNLSHEAVAGSYIKEWRAARNRYRKGITYRATGDRTNWINPVHLSKNT
jgi:hypothetical protein